MLSSCQRDYQGDVVSDGEGDQRDEAGCPHPLRQSSTYSGDLAAHDADPASSAKTQVSQK